MRIELEDAPQAFAVSLTQALVRVVLAGVAVWHAAQKVLQPAQFSEVIARFGVPEVDKWTLGMAALEALLGLGLLLGRFTRTAAFVLACDLAAGGAILWRYGELLRDPSHVEALALALSSCVVLVVIGGGPLGLDAYFHRRARLRAIARDETWSRPPYVSHG